MKSRHTKRTGARKLLGPVTGIIILLAAGYLGGTLYFQNKFLPNTVVNGNNLSRDSVEAANKELLTKADSTLFSFTENGTVTQKIDLENIGKKIDFTSELKTLLAKQNAWTWPSALVGKSSNSLGNFAITDDELNTYVTSTLTPALTALNKDRKKSTNATLAFADGKFSVVPETNGNYLDADKIVADLKTKIAAGKKTLELEDYTTPATIKKDDPTLASEITQAEKIANVSANYKINGELINIPTATIQSWLTFTDGKVGLNNDSVSAYVTDLGAKYNTSTNPYTFTSTKRGQVEVPAGTYSWSILVKAETAALTEAILAGEDFTRTPETQGSSSPNEPRVGTTYIEVDKTNQHMWFYKDGALVLETDVVTGKPKSPTPSGVFYIWKKEPNATLKGLNDDGTPYASPVKYWMPIDWTGVGIHDSDWQPQYGGTWYELHGSHGCVNTPPTVMAKLYSLVSENTPVLVF